MRRFATGLSLGLALGLAASLLWRQTGDKHDRPDYDSGPANVPTSKASAPVKGKAQPETPPATRQPLKPEPTTSLDASSFWLRVGEGYTLGKGPVAGKHARQHADIYCQDIRHGASLRCQHGAAAVKIPLSSAGLPKTVAGVAAIAPRAPLDLAQRDLWLLPAPSRSRPGVGFARGNNGTVVRLFLRKLKPHPDVLQRQVLVQMEVVEQHRNGGELRLPKTSGVQADPATHRMLERVLRIAKAIPGDSFGSYLNRDYSVTQRLLGTLQLKKSLLVKDPLQATLEIDGAGLIAEGGLLPQAKITLESSAGLSVKGDAAGEVDVRGYSFIHISGNLTGVVRQGSYCTTIIEGDLQGKLDMRSYSDVLIRGRIRGNLAAHGSCWSTVYIASFVSKLDLAQWKGDSSVTLHLRSSDLATGEHKELGGWRTVLVGAQVWKRLDRSMR